MWEEVSPIAFCRLVSSSKTKSCSFLTQTMGPQKTSAPIGAWKCNFSCPFRTLWQANQQINQSTNQQDTSRPTNQNGRTWGVIGKFRCELSVPQLDYSLLHRVTDRRQEIHSYYIPCMLDIVWLSPLLSMFCLSLLSYISLEFCLLSPFPSIFHYWIWIFPNFSIN